MTENPYTPVKTDEHFGYFADGSAMHLEAMIEKRQAWQEGHQAGVKDALEEVEKFLSADDMFNCDCRICKGKKKRWQSLKKKLMGVK